MPLAQVDHSPMSIFNILHVVLGSCLEFSLVVILRDQDARNARVLSMWHGNIIAMRVLKLNQSMREEYLPL